MAYDTKELTEKALAAIKENNLVFIEDVVAFLPCVKKTFYEHKLHESHDIKSALESNKVQMKVRLRQTWLMGDNATAQIALYKIIGDETELRRLTGQTIIGDQDKPLQHVVKLKTEDLDSDPIE